eukprot:jgi/Undpi1/9788/HiC_scaffold_27.g12243.m1
MKVASALALGLALGPRASAKTIEVFGDQNDAEPAPLQAAIDLAEPGDTIVMNAGLYHEDLKTVRDGTLDAPITIAGPKSAVIRGKSGGSVMDINHDFIHLRGFSVDGSGEQEQADELDPEAFHEHLIDVHGNRVRVVFYDQHEHRSGVMGFKADGLTLSHAAGTCIKMSYFVTHSEIVDSDILECGMSTTACEDDSVDGCGRGLDLGTPPARRTENIGEETDVSAWNTIKRNTFSGVGGACIIIHEGARSNLVDSSTCIDSNDANSAGMVVRGIANILRSNYITGAAGAGLALGGTEDGEECELSGVFNQVSHNQLASNVGGALLDGALPQPSGTVCRNGVDEGTFPELSQECPDEEVATGSDKGGGGVEVAAPKPAPKAAPKATSTVPKGAEVTQGGESKYRCHPVLLSASDVTSSNAEGADEKFDAEVLLDRDPKTFWSLEGMGEWLEFDLFHDSVVDPPTVEAVKVQFLDGKKHKGFFEVRADGEGVLREAASSGTTDEPEVFKFPGGGVKAKKIRFVGLGSMDADAEFSKWNSVSSIALCEGTPMVVDGRKTEEGSEP